MSFMKRWMSSGSLIADSGLMLFSLVIGAGLAFATSVVIARSLSVDQYGILSLFLSLQGFIVIFASFGVPRALAKFVPEHLVTDSLAAGRIARCGLLLIVVISVAVSALYASLSELIGTGLYRDSRLDVLVPFSAMVVLTTALLSGVSGLAQGYRNIGIVAFIRVASPLVSFVSILFLLPEYGIEGVFMGYCIGQAVTAMASLYIVHARNPEFLAFSSRAERTGSIPRGLLRFSNLSFLSNIVIVAGVWAGTSILTLTVSLEAVGYFGIAYGFYTVLILVPAAIAVPFLPKVSVLSLESTDGVRHELDRVLRAISSLTFPLVIALGLLSEAIIELAYGPQYLPARHIVLLMILSSYINSGATIITTAFVGIGRISLYLRFQVIWAAVLVAVAFLLIPPLGVVGLGMAYVISYLAVFAVSSHSSISLLQTTAKGSTGIASLGFALVSIVFLMMAVQQIPFAITILAGVACSMFMIRFHKSD